jgi:hypothetical protein
VAPTVRFRVTRGDVTLLLGELSEHRPAGHAALYAPLLEALLAAVARLDTEASRHDTMQQQTTALLLNADHAAAFREWLASATGRAVGDDPEKVLSLMRIYGSGQ